MNREATEQPQIYVLRIMEGTRCVAEAPLIIHEPTEALRNFYEALPAAAGMIAGGVIGAMQNACSEQPTPGFVGLNVQSNHSGIQIVGEIPRNGNGHGRS